MRIAMAAETEIYYRGPVEAAGFRKNPAHTLGNRCILEIGFHHDDVRLRRNALKRCNRSGSDARDVSAVSVRVETCIHRRAGEHCAEPREIDAGTISLNGLVPQTEHATGKRRMAHIETGIDNTDNHAASGTLSLLPKFGHADQGPRKIHERSKLARRGDTRDGRTCGQFRDAAHRHQRRPHFTCASHFQFRKTSWSACALDPDKNMHRRFDRVGSDRAWCESTRQHL
jgi:hypothetical protein